MGVDDGNPGGVDSGDQALKVLENAEESEEVVIGGKTIKNPKHRLAHFKQVMEIAQRLFDFDPEDLHFKSFGGETVGEATAEGIYIDAVMLMHPINRLANVIFHEIAHDGGNIQNEGLVEEYARAAMLAAGLIGEDLKLTGKYDLALNNFHAMVESVAKNTGKNKWELLTELYDLYYNQNYEKIYEVCVGDENEDDAKLDYFKAAFPELEVYEDGRFEVRKFEKPGEEESPEDPTPTPVEAPIEE